MEENTPLLGSRPTPSARRTRSFSDADYRNFLITPRAPRPPCLPPPPLPAAPPPTPPPLPPRARVNVIDYGRDLCVEHAPLVSYADSPPMQAANRVIFVEHAHEREMCLLADSLNIIELRTLLTTASTFLPRVEVYDDQRIVIAVDAPLPDNRDTHSTSYDTHSTTITFRDNQPDTANARRTDTEFVPIVLMADTVRNIILCVHSANSCGAASLRFKIASVLRGNVDDVRRHGVIHLLCIAVTILVDRFYPLLEVEGDTLDEVEAMLLTETSSSIYGTQEDIVRMIARTKRSMLEVRRRLWPFRRCLARLSLVPLRGDDVSGSRFYTRALLDHVANLLSVLDLHRDSAHSLLDVYLNAQNNRMQEVMQKIAVVTTIFVPLTFLTGLEGMNFTFMPELGGKYSYFFFLCFILSIVFLMIIWFRKRGWL